MLEIDMNLVKQTYTDTNLHQKMEEKIRPWLDIMQKENHPDIAKKQIELCQIGKLLATYFNEYSIKELRESPDFVISNGTDNIGLEHQIIIENNTKQKEGFFENLCARVENEIATTTDLGNFAINLYFNKGIESQISKKNEIISVLKAIVVEKITNDRLLPNPYVYNACVMKHNRISIIANFGAFMQKQLGESEILEAIKKKEKLIESYRANTFQNQWLVLVIGQVNESSFEVRTDFEMKNQSKFDKVFVYEDFNNQLFELI